MDWYYERNGSQYGPLPESTIVDFIQRRELYGFNKVRNAKTNKWVYIETAFPSEIALQRRENPSDELVATSEISQSLDSGSSKLATDDGRSERWERQLNLLVAFPFRLAWNTLVIVGSIALTVAWLGFVFGSVVGVVLLLVFFPGGFLLPLGLLALVVPLWPDYPDR